MPAAGQARPTSLRSVIRLYLLDHPGPQTAVAITRGIGHSDQQAVSKECQRLARRGQLVRHTIDNPDAGQERARPTTSGFTLAGA